jgi:hypothetical protein
MGGDLCRPLQVPLSVLGRKPWRERPRCRHRKWPCHRPSQGRSRHGRPFPCQCPNFTVGAAEEPQPGTLMRALVRAKFPGQLCRRTRMLQSTDRASFQRCLLARSSGQSSSPARHGQDSMSVTACQRTRARSVPLGHHSFDARSVLGGVQGSSLRFDRAHARPSGLDAAFAQRLKTAIT